MSKVERIAALVKKVNELNELIDNHYCDEEFCEELNEEVVELKNEIFHGEMFWD